MSIEDEVRDVLRTRGDELSPQEDAWSQIERRLDGAVPPVPHESRRRVVAAVVALLIALAGSVLLVEAFRNHTTPALPRPTATSNGLIAFSGRDGAIWTMNPDGTGLRQIPLEGLGGPSSAFAPYVVPRRHPHPVLALAPGKRVRPLLDGSGRFESQAGHRYSGGRRGSGELGTVTT